MAISLRHVACLAALMFACVFAIMAADPPASSPPATPSPDDLLKQDFKAALPRIPPTEPADALAKFTVAPGFKIEQVAAEPLVNSPVAMEWDENGRLFVCEMRGYSENRDEKLSRVSMLEDVDDDGRYDRSTVFADGLLWPTALFPFDGGLFVGDAPEVWYFKDTDGDGRADQKTHVYTGFGTSNVQGLLNCFRWGLDNRIHLATSSIGGDIRKAADEKAKPVNVRGRDIAFNPRTYDFMLTSGASQHGMCFDDWGRKFVSSNSNHIQQVMYEDRYVARNPYLSAPDARVSIAADGPQAEVYRTSPVEPWRVIRTQLRVSGAVKGAVEGGGRAAGYFTGATGVTIYRGDAFPAEWKGMAVVGDVGSNLVHRKRLEPNGLEFIARRIDEKSEFVSSSDIWFRPAQFANGPDGALYILDVYREVIEHPASLPPMIKQHLDLTAGRDRGRLYRVIPEGFKHRPTPKLGQATTLELVALLEHPNAWHRETAARLLWTRQDKSAVEPLKKLATNSASPLGRMHALYALDGMAALEAQQVIERLHDEHAQVRRHSVRLSERVPRDPALGEQLITMADDTDIEVIYQLTFTLGEIRDARINDADAIARLGAIFVAYGMDRWVQVAVQSSLAGQSEPMLNKMLTLTKDDSSYRRLPAFSLMLEKLAVQIALENDAEQVRRTVELLDSLPADEAPLALAITRGLSQGLKRPGSELSKLAAEGKLGRMDKVVTDMLAASLKTAGDDAADPKRRVAAIDGLGMGKFADLGPTFGKLIDNRQPIEVQLAAVATLGKFQDAGVAEVLLAAWPKLSPQVKEPALEALFARSERINVLLDAVEKGTFKPIDVPPARVQALTRGGGNEAMKSRVQQLLGSQMVGRRADVIAAYRDALKLPGDIARGRALFQKNCNACHRTENKGVEIGPNLVAIKTRGPEVILTNVLDPSREVNPQFVNYLCTLDDGRTLTGLISAESATSITLKRAEGQTDTVLRVNIEELASTGLSIMPEGLEKMLDVQGMADVIAYLMQVE